MKLREEENKYKQTLQVQSLLIRGNKKVERVSPAFGRTPRGISHTPLLLPGLFSFPSS